MHSPKTPMRFVVPMSVATRAVATRAFAFGLGLLVAQGFAVGAQAQQRASKTPFSLRAASVQVKRDSMTITLAPLARTEVKLVMKKDQKAQFSWKSDDAEVTYNLHGEGPAAPGGKAHTYKRGESKAETGEIVALFDGIHGWSWRNTSEKPVKITVTAWGQFSELKKM